MKDKFSTDERQVMKMGTSFLGVSTPTNRQCAVEDCKEQGFSRTCPYDERRHSHGMIHYDCGYPKSALKFREGWWLICDEHYAFVAVEREKWMAERHKEVA